MERGRCHAPTEKHGKICHVELPATDLERSAHFYEQTFDRNARRHLGGLIYIWGR